MKEIFVFGSNLSGIHGAGAAKYAFKEKGAIWGQGVGLQGNSYGIPTKDANIQTMSLEDIIPYIKEFLVFAQNNEDMLFRLTPIGCGLAGHKRADIWAVLHENFVPVNVVLSREWVRDY